jgi:biotin-dependent carboxylase-like uncharacterized protein
LKALRVEHPGLLATVQDLGRPGLAALGVPLSGALDADSARLANRLVGNPDESAVVEMTVSGARFEALDDVVVAAAGAWMPARLNGAEAPAGRSVRLRPGDRLEFGPAADGCRTYLAAAGGIDVAPVLGSRSTQMSPGFGGLGGRALRKGDLLKVGPAPGVSPQRSVPPAGLARFPRPARVRVLPGLQEELFSGTAIEAFLGSTWRASSRSNRLGVRLEGGTIAPARQAEIPPEAVVPGSIQVPAGGEPIVLLAEGPVTGGYPKIAVAISADLPVLAQLRPGDPVRFERTTLAQAARARLAHEEIFGTIREE